MTESRVRVGSIVFDCDHFDRMREFWSGALGYEHGPVEPEAHRFVVMRDAKGRGPNLSISEGEPERGRLHLDLYTESPESEVDRLVALGAKVYAARQPGTDFTVLEDPEGNLFCVVDTRH